MDFLFLTILQMVAVVVVLWFRNMIILFSYLPYASEFSIQCIIEPWENSTYIENIETSGIW